MRSSGRSRRSKRCRSLRRRELSPGRPGRAEIVGSLEVGLSGVASLRALLEAVEELQARRARELGCSWQQIAELLGVSKQAVHQKIWEAAIGAPT